jgi:integrase
MTGLCKHPQTGQWWFRKATPVDLYAKRSELAAMGISITREVKHTLAVKSKEAFNKVEAEKRAAKALATCLQRFDSMRDALKKGPTKLSGKQIAAMAGDIARRLLASDPNLNEGDAIVFVSNIPRIVDMLGTGEVKAKWRNAVELFELIAEQGLDHYKSNPKIRKVIDGFVAQALLKQGIVAVDNQSRLLLEARIVKDLPAHAQMLAAMQEDGDYRLPETFAGRPELSNAFPVASAKFTFSQLLEGWRLNKKPSPSSVKAYTNWCNAFVKWRKSGDATTITRKEMLEWRDALQADHAFNDKGRKGKLDGVRGIIEWGITNEKLTYSINPAKGVTIDASKSEREGWPDAQAALLLTKARDQKGYLRWSTLLMAVTGARAGEIAQLRVSDLFEDDKGQWAVTITAKAGRLKTEASERTIPLHSVVVTEGLPAFVNGLKSAGDKDARLFPEFFSEAVKRKAAKSGNAETEGLSQASGKRYQTWIYGPEVGLVKDKRYASRHSWRHRIATLMREHCEQDAEARLSELIGHAKMTITSKYGKGAPLRLLREAVESIPSEAIFGVVQEARGA